MVTLKQLAEELSLSVSSVSKALSDSHEISESTKGKVLELAKKRNYIPNRTAINLRNRQTNTIGVIIPNIFNHFYTKILSGIEKEAKLSGYRTIISISNEKIEAEKDGLSYFSNGSVDGILLAPSEETEKNQDYNHISELKSKNIPFVFFDRYSKEIESDKVIINDFESAKNTINYFNSTGRKDIVVVSLLKNLSVGKLRSEGVLSASKDVVLLEFEDEIELQNELNNYLKNNNVSAIFSLDELSGIIALNLVRQLGINIPKEISIISFSQGILSEYSFPKLSTINQHAEEIGKNSVKLLIERLKNKEASFETRVIETSLEISQT